MPTVGPNEILIFLLLAALILYFSLRGRVSGGVLVVLILVLLIPVAGALLLVVGTIFSVLSV